MNIFPIQKELILLVWQMNNMQWSEFNTLSCLGFNPIRVYFHRRVVAYTRVLKRQLKTRACAHARVQLSFQYALVLDQLSFQHARENARVWKYTLRHIYRACFQHTLNSARFLHAHDENTSVELWP
jgi:hypothetical protein